ncbi:MAG: hypothetical protein V4719_18660 [Planctomycetota bacterium]
MRGVRCTYLELMLFAGFSILGVSGCNSGGGLPEATGPEGSATGKVSYQGKPITAGTIVLDSGKGYLAMAPIKSDGTFELKGADGAVFPGGEYKVGVQPPAAVPVPGATEMPKPPAIPGVPQKFYNTNSSGVTVKIEEGDQELNIVLK